MFDSLIANAAAVHQVPASWIRAVIEVESNWNPRAYNGSDPGGGAYGLMQILGSTARGLGYDGDFQNLFEPALNIDLGAQLLAELRGRFGDDFRRVYSAYNSGRPDLWQTSTQVAANVSKAMAALSNWIESEVSEISSAAAAGEGPSLANVLLVGGLLWLLFRR
jgi:soluble lytic murein transglycosylase-like protein